MANTTSPYLRTVFLILLTTAVAPHYARAADKHALLIGIANYPLPAKPIRSVDGTPRYERGIKPLRGPIKDIALLREVLEKKFGPFTSIDVLLNEQAKHSDIKRAFERLQKRVKRGDHVFVYYGGHGAVNTCCPKEWTGQCQTLVPYGSSQGLFRGENNKDILDKTLYQWMKPLYALTADVVWVSDSCHSADNARGPSLTPRQADPDPACIDFVDAEPPPSSEDVPGVRIGASRDDEKAYELETEELKACDKETRHECAGIFTWYFVKALREARPGELWKDVFRRTATLMASGKHGSLQNPRISGPGKERALFGGVFVDRKRSAFVQRVDAESKRVTLDVGRIDGATVDSVYSAKPSKQTGLANTTVKLFEVGSFQSIGLLATGSAQISDPLFEEIHHYPFEPTRIALIHSTGLEVDALAAKDLRIGLGQPQGYKIVEKVATPDWLVQIVRPQKNGDRYLDWRPGDRLPQSSPGADPEVWITNNDHLPIHPSLRLSLADARAGRLSSTLERLAWASELKQIESSEKDPFPLDVKVTISRPDASLIKNCEWEKDGRITEEKTILGTYALARTPSPLKCGDKLKIRFSNSDASRSWYVYIVEIRPDAKISLRYPKSDQAVAENALIKPNSEVTIEKGSILDQIGATTIKLFVTSQHIKDASIFVQPGATKSTSDTRLERLLAAASSGRRATLETGDWAATQITVDVRAKVDY